MSFWDGTRWVPDEVAAPLPLPARTHRPRKRVALVLVLGLLLVLPGAVFAGGKTRATLDVVFTYASISGSMPYATPYTVTGCGYDPANGGVTVLVQSPEAYSFAGGLPDANGCISVSNFSTQGPGSYDLTAYQTIRHKSKVMARTSFTLS